MRKRSIAVILALLMVCGLVLPVAASLKPFADVPEHHWAYEAVLQLQAAGLIEGYPDGSTRDSAP